MCQWCSSALPRPRAPTPPPVPSQGPLPAPVSIPAGRTSSAALIGVIVLVAVMVVIAVAFVSVASNPPSTPPPNSSVDITGLHVVSLDNACGLNGDSSGTVTLHPPSGYPFIIWGVPGPSGSVPCTVQSVTTNTPGFELFASFPFNVTQAPSILLVSMLPPASFVGVLNVTFT